MLQSKNEFIFGFAGKSLRNAFARTFGMIQNIMKIVEINEDVQIATLTHLEPGVWLQTLSVQP